MFQKKKLTQMNRNRKKTDSGLKWYTEQPKSYQTEWGEINRFQKKRSAKIITIFSHIEAIVIIY